MHPPGNEYANEGYQVGNVIVLWVSCSRAPRTSLPSLLIMYLIKPTLLCYATVTILDCHISSVTVTP